MATKTIKPAVRPRRSKADVEQEFSAIHDEVSAAREAVAPKTEELFKAKEAEVRQAVEGITVEVWCRESRASASNFLKHSPIFQRSSYRKSTAPQERIRGVPRASSQRRGRRCRTGCTIGPTEVRAANHLLQKETEAEKRLAELRIRTVEETIAQQNAQIATLQKQLDDAKQQVQEIAVKAIEGAKALSHINSIAMEQAKHRVPQG